MNSSLVDVNVPHRNGRTWDFERLGNLYCFKILWCSNVCFRGEKKKNHPPLPCKSVLIDQSTNLVFFETIDNFAFNVAWERFMTETVLTVWAQYGVVIKKNNLKFGVLPWGRWCTLSEQRSHKSPPALQTTQFCLMR